MTSNTHSVFGPVERRIELALQKARGHVLYSAQHSPYKEDGERTLRQVDEALVALEEETRLAPQLANGLRLALTSIEKGEPLDTDILAVMHAVLAIWETR